MQIISIDAHQMNSILDQEGQNQLDAALSSQMLDSIPLNHPDLPPKVKHILQWVQWQKRIPKTFITQGFYFSLIMLWTALYYQTFIWGIVGSIALAVILSCIFMFYTRSKTWAKQKLKILLATPFMLIHNDRLYENLPQLRKMDAEITMLEQHHNNAQVAVNNIEKLIRKLKEKLILLGESTDDPQIHQMETEKISQGKIIEKSTALLLQIRTHRSEQDKVKQEIAHRLELQSLRQKAAILTGDGDNENSLRKLTEIEMQATTMVLEINQMQRELQAINLRWKTLEEIDKN